MVLNQLRSPVHKIFQPLFDILAKLGVHPNAITLVGVAFSFLAGWAFYAGQYLLAALGIFLSGFMDGLDGGVARAMGYESSRGAFLDSIMDRIGEIVIYTGLILSFTQWYNQLAAITLFASAFFVSYVRAKADSLGINLMGIGIMERAERMSILFFMGILGFFFGSLVFLIIMYGLLILTFITAVHRFIKTYYLLEKPVTSI